MKSSLRRSSLTTRNLSNYTNSQPQAHADNRYWESYLVRYLLPTVVGAALVWILLWQIPDSYGLPNILTKKASVDTTFLLLLGLAGFVYCYLSSSLVLVMHYGRWKGWSDDKNSLRLFSGHPATLKQRLKTVLNSTAGTALVASVIFGAVLFGFIKLIITNGVSASINLNDLYFMMVALFAVAWQWVTTWQVMTQKHEMYAFYKALASARSQAGNYDYVESYRHLREHGNAFFIVLAEILFFFYLYVGIKLILPERQPIFPAMQIAIGTILLVAWIIPGVYAWHLGTALELQLAREHSKAPPHAP